MTEGSVSQTASHSSFGIQIAGDGNNASITVNINALEGLPASVQTAILEKAHQRLAGLPTEQLPPHGTFAGRMQLPRNALFVGREADLLALAGLLKGGEQLATAITPAAAATGLGGIGKTQTAVEFVHRYGQYFLGGVFWLNFADPALIDNELELCGREMQLPGFDTFDQAARIQIVRRIFNNPVPRLLIYDNCEDELILREYLPVTGGSRVLITSRREQWDSTLTIQVQPIGLLSVDEGVALLSKLNPHLDERYRDDLEQIARELGGLPLALHLAGSYLHQYRNSLSPANVLAELRQENALERRLLTGAFSKSELPTKHDKSVARTFALSAGKLDVNTAEGSLAWQVLICAACMAPGDPIPDALIKRCVLPDDSDLNALLAVDDAVQSISNLGLADTQPSLRMHRLVSQFVRTEKPHEMSVILYKIENVIATEATNINEDGLPQAMVSLLPHLTYLSEWASKRGSNNASELLSCLGRYLQSIANYTSARVAYERALKIDESTYGLVHPIIARDVDNLGRVLYELGDFDSARTALERSLRIDQTVFGSNDPRCAIRINNLSSLLQDLGDLEGARAGYMQALELMTQAVQDQDLSTHTLILNNLGEVLRVLGNLTDAQAAFEKALKIDESIFGSAHPNIARDINNIGGVLLDSGDLAGARAAYERALLIDEAVYGTMHPKFAVRLSSLGKMLKILGDPNGAQAALERALAIDIAVYGSTHPDVARDLNHLGNLQKDLDKLDDARKSFERALEIDEAIYGIKHPKIAFRVSNLGMVLKDMDDLAGARDAFERALQIYRLHFAANHPNIRNTQDILNGVLNRMNELPASP